MTLGDIERSNQGNLVFIGLCIIHNVLLDSGAVRPRGLLFLNRGWYSNPGSYHKLIKFMEVEAYYISMFIIIKILPSKGKMPIFLGSAL